MFSVLILYSGEMDVTMEEVKLTGHDSGFRTGKRFNSLLTNYDFFRIVNNLLTIFCARIHLVEIAHVFQVCY